MPWYPGWLAIDVPPRADLGDQYVHLVFDPGLVEGIYPPWEFLAMKGKLLLWPSPPTEPEPPSLVGMDMMRRFAPIPEVTAIFQGGSQGEPRFWVFTRNEQYDDHLMSRLITEEKKILRSHRGRGVDILYIPVSGVPDMREVVGPSAELIFQR
jgi:hypothetical protein